MTLVTHTDADGYGCRYLLEKAGYVFDNVIHMDYGSEEYLINYLDNTVESKDLDKLFITDLSLKPELLNDLMSIFNEVYVFDHHISTKREEEALGKIGINLVCDTSVSATKLLHKTYKEKLKHDIGDLVEKINAADIYLQNEHFIMGLTMSDIVKNEEVMFYDKKDVIDIDTFRYNINRYNEYYNIFIEKFYDMIVTNSCKVPSSIDICNDLTIRATYSKSRFQGLIDLNVDLIKNRIESKEAKVVKIGGKSIVILESLDKLSYLSFVFFENNKHIDGMIFVNEDTGTIACRANTVSDLDMSILAKEITDGNGGGHQKAAGGRFPELFGFNTYKELCISKLKEL